MISDNSEFDIIINLIQKQRNNGLSWEEIYNVEFAPTSDKKQFVESLFNIGAEITEEEWNQIVNELRLQDQKIEITKLGRRVRNNAKIPTDEHSAWQLYKKNLEEKGFSKNSIKEIEKSSLEILKGLSTDTKVDGAIKGLVVGNVQSGKTANMAGLMALAADHGFNYFIILSGIIENLRKQTARRLFNDMNAYGQGKWHWNHIENPSLKANRVGENISEFDLSPKSKDKYFTVCLKNKSRLTELSKWLLSDKNKAKQLKVLIIDDEADQASINTNSIEEENYTAINGTIRNLVNNNEYSGMNYVSYTATPYANVLNETSKNSLYPRDFIFLLEPSEDYFGPKQMFGTEEPEKSPSLDIILPIDDRDVDIVRSIQSGEGNDPLPNSFKEAIHWFLLTVACMRNLKYRKPISMLVHTSFKITHHNIIASKINDYLLFVKQNFEDVKHQIYNLYEREQNSLTLENFKENMKDYSTLDDVPDYPKWDKVLRELRAIMRLEGKEYVSHIGMTEDGPSFHSGIHIAIDNSKANTKDEHVRLVYPENKNMPEVAPAFIVVGGNTLSRGLTLEGLTTSYFLRTTNQADTLMQMGRWFGYRKGYELFPRVWMDELALERFTFLSQLNEELREEIRMYDKTNKTPEDFAPRIKNSPNYQLIRITSQNKSQSAEASAYNFAGFNSQTVYFENNFEELRKNIEITEKFLNNIENPEIKSNKMIWRGVNKDAVNQFLRDYKVCEADTKMTAIPALIEWLEKEGHEIEDWNVILSTVGKIEDTKNENNGWKIHGYSPSKVNRSKLGNRSNEKITCIGALRVPSDLIGDVDTTGSKLKTVKISEVMDYREKHGLRQTPQLIIYRINKDSVPKKDSSNSRVSLNFVEDIIGINIMIPSMQNSNNANLTTYIHAKIDANRNNIDEEEFSESGEE